MIYFNSRTIITLRPHHRILVATSFSYKDSFMVQDKSASDANFKAVKKIALPDGLRVGIVNLDGILSRVAELNINDTGALKKELIKLAAEDNYIPGSAEREYAAALFEEYRRKFMPDTKSTIQIERHKHTPG